jgi:CRISPR-associated protein Cas5d
MATGDPGDYFADEDRAQRNTIALRDVDYAVEAHFVLTVRCGPGDNVTKFEEMFARRVMNGQHHYQPYLGCREFPATVEPYADSPSPVPETRPLGTMLHDITYGAKNQPVFFPALLRNGEVEIPAWTGAAQ